MGFKSQRDKILLAAIELAYYRRIVSNPKGIKFYNSGEAVLKELMGRFKSQRDKILRNRYFTSYLTTKVSNPKGIKFYSFARKT